MVNAHIVRNIILIKIGEMEVFGLLTGSVLVKHFVDCQPRTELLLWRDILPALGA